MRLKIEKIAKVAKNAKATRGRSHGHLHEHMHVHRSDRELAVLAYRLILFLPDFPTNRLADWYH